MTDRRAARLLLVLTFCAVCVAVAAFGVRASDVLTIQSAPPPVIRATMQLTPARDDGQWKNVDRAQRQFYESLKSRGGAVYCFDADGVDVQWRVGRDGYEVFIHQWRKVPADAVVPTSNRYGVSKVWLTYDGAIRCFLPGSLT